MHISEIVDEVVESIDRPSINARGVAEGTARGLVRDLLTYEDVRPEEYRQAWRQLVSLLGREEAHALLAAGRDAVARRTETADDYSRRKPETRVGGAWSRRSRGD